MESLEELKSQIASRDTTFKQFHKDYYRLSVDLSKSMERLLGNCKENAKLGSRCRDLEGRVWELEDSLG